MAHKSGKLLLISKLVVKMWKMIGKYLDRTSLSLTTILISGAGLFTVLTKYYVPGLNLTYLDGNPFAVKGHVIDSVMTWIFTSLALIGLLIQVIVLIWGENISNRLYNARIYFMEFCIGFISMVILVYSLTTAGNYIARNRWLPKIVSDHKEMYNRAKFIIEHNGLSEDHVMNKESQIDSLKNIQANFQEADRYLTQIENILDIPPNKTDRQVRIERLKHFFDH
jgi:hypothetical protein